MFIADDASPKEDVERMSELADEIETGESVVGHCLNAQRILNRVFKSDEEFVLYYEDDWILTSPGCFIMASLDVLATRPDIGQVCWGVPNVQFKQKMNTRTGTKFFVRQKRVGVNYPPFTLNPSVMRVSALREIGDFKGPEFERNFGERWSAKGWKTADLWPPALRHIGEVSAYDLNQSTR